jgi:uncharacterized protein
MRLINKGLGRMPACARRSGSGRCQWRSGGRAQNLSAPRLLGEVAGDFTFQARVEIASRDTFDAGALLAWVDDQTWGKLCFEASPAGQPMVVSVVTRGTSDDANAFDVETAHIWLRIARMGGAFAFHASRDGAAWQLVRHFPLPGGPSVHIGLLGQSPTGRGSRATFSQIRLADRRLDEIRDGT